MNDPAVAALAGALTGLVTAAATRPVLWALPSPAGEEPTSPVDAEPVYPALGTTRFVVGCGALAAGAGGLAWLVLPYAVQPAWSVLATLGVLLAAIDARTTWLPWRLTRVAWGLMVLALPAGLLLGGRAELLGRAALGAVAAGLLYLGAWAFSRGGFGFGDVRFAPLLGAGTAAHSWTLLGWGLVLGTVVGGVYGLARLARGRRGAFAYGPSMLAGVYLAVALVALA